MKFLIRIEESFTQIWWKSLPLLLLWLALGLLVVHNSLNDIFLAFFLDGLRNFWRHCMLKTRPTWLDFVLQIWSAWFAYFFQLFSCKDTDTDTYSVLFRLNTDTSVFENCTGYWILVFSFCSTKFVLVRSLIWTHCALLDHQVKHVQ